ncbi:MAG: hypothetical protein HZB79_09040 [Deltaproteobacteria bacterium]|nr:hypothetical protein [Nitrospirota bacterium]MBI5893777.1 hypothetical protein [Deltaproteobacteria bacterium]
MKIYAAALTFLFLISSTAIADDKVFNAAGPFGGIVTSVIEDADGAIFIGTEGGGIYKTTDNGNTWLPASSGLANPFVYSLAKTPDGSMFAGTKAGIFKSTNQGMNWILETGASKGHLVPFVSSNKEGKVYASIWGSGVCKKIDNDWKLYSINDELHNTFVNGITFTKDGAALAATEGGVYGLGKGENKWRFVGLLEYLVQSIVIDNSGHIYASVWGSGIQRSKDNGKEWESFGKGAHSYVRHLSINQNNEIFAGTEDGVFKFSPDVKEWKSIGLKGVFIRNIAPIGNDRLFAGSYGKGIYISNDKGKTWQQKNNGIANTQIISAFADENTIYAGTSWGLFIKQKDKVWEEAVLFSGKRVQAIAKDSKGNIYAGTTSGVFKYNASDKKWERVKGHPAAYSNTSVVAIDKNDSVFAGIEGDGFFRSDDIGGAWKALENGLTNKRILAVAFDSKDRIYIGTANGIFRNAKEDRDRFEDMTGNLKNTIIQSIAIDKDGNIYAGTDGGGVFVKSGDKAWEEKNNGLKNKRVLSLKADNKGNVYAGTHDGLFLLEKDASEWKDASGDMVNRIVQTINMDSAGRLLIGTWGGGILTK